jgi:phosphohistidine phosphatase
MIKLWVLRHGDAEDPAAGMDDFDRSLTATGREEATAAGRALAATGVKPDLVLSSPRVRARQTAELATAELGVGFEVHEPLTGGFRAEDALSLMEGRDGQTILLVGHMPDLAIVVRDLTFCPIPMRTGGLAHVRGSGADWELAVLLRPKETGGY